MMPEPRSPRSVDSVPVLDASIVAPYPPAGTPAAYELRIGTQRYIFAHAFGVWSAPAGTPQATIATIEVPYLPNDPAERVVIWVESLALLTGRDFYPWVKIDEQYLKVVTYGPLPSPLIEVPRRGFGAQMATIKANAVVSVVDTFALGETTRRYDLGPADSQAEAVRPQPIGADVVMTVRSFTGANVHEQIVQDGRYSRTGATNRGTREVADFNQALYSIQFESIDLHAKPGRMQSYTVPHPPNTPSTGSLMILTAELAWPVWGQPPRRACTAATVHPADVVDSWLVDRR